MAPQDRAERPVTYDMSKLTFLIAILVIFTSPYVQQAEIVIETHSRALIQLDQNLHPTYNRNARVGNPWTSLRNHPHQSPRCCYSQDTPGNKDKSDPDMAKSLHRTMVNVERVT
ncbi:hypothetical protein C8R32_101275 [Nitrosospira sp. Nsp5]|uniref:Uncharacterized protein n=1 Tax=Nitrosospira multiformis TaxID=1231 RepID=A0ABY0TKT4_9PROT|nr:hypothetical protein C8R32_101275 [Nitrosospira sp. Nsp5]SDQ76114.1 hypothetical protein SAMN05216402_2181 [Nitrosospira multiformis]